jgi:hypothetical protein
MVRAELGMSTIPILAYGSNKHQNTSGAFSNHLFQTAKALPEGSAFGIG